MDKEKGDFLLFFEMSTTKNQMVARGSAVNSPIKEEVWKRSNKLFHSPFHAMFSPNALGSYARRKA